jgi:5-(carboxyamino)imidazole ribonucleotide mutase
MKKTKVAIVMGSETDLPTMQEATKSLDECAIPYEIKIVSAHRTPQAMYTFAKSAHKKYSIIIAGAGAAAHLPGMIACLTILPVIGVPVPVGKLQGLDALLSIVQMPKGVPVATVAIDNAYNAGLLAARILGVHDFKISKKLLEIQIKQKNSVQEMNSRLKSKKL